MHCKHKGGHKGSITSFFVICTKGLSALLNQGEHDGRLRGV